MRALALLAGKKMAADSDGPLEDPNLAGFGAPWHEHGQELWSFAKLRLCNNVPAMTILLVQFPRNTFGTSLLRPN